MTGFISLLSCSFCSSTQKLYHDSKQNYPKELGMRLTRYFLDISTLAMVLLIALKQVWKSEDLGSDPGHDGLPLWVWVCHFASSSPDAHSSNRSNKPEASDVRLMGQPSARVETISNISCYIITCYILLYYYIDTVICNPYKIKIKRSSKNLITKRSIDTDSLWAEHWYWLTMRGVLILTHYEGSVDTDSSWAERWYWPAYGGPC